MSDVIVRCWGVRGSTPSSAHCTRRYGGNTACLTVTLPSGRTLVFDAGTGIRTLGDAMRRGSRQAADGDDGRGATEVSLFLTHAHWDHVQGLPFFAPLYVPGSLVRIYTPVALRDAAERVIRAQMQSPVFPVHFDALAARVEFHALDESGLTLDGVTVRPVAARHADDAAMWTVGRTGHDPWIVYAPDNEIRATQHDALRDGWLRACARASLLVHDATFLPTELPAYSGWGHSAWNDVVDLGIAAGVERVVLFHHHPDRDDDAVDRILSDARDHVRAAGSAMRVVAASEGLVLRA